MKNKFILILSIAFILFMTGLLIYYLLKGDSSRWQVSLGGILVSALPLFLLLLKNNPFPIPLIMGYYLFLFCSIYFGSISSFYLKYKWWDTTIHLYKGIYMGFITIVLYKLLIPRPSREGVSKWVLFLFVLSLSITSGVLWEIYEFVGDLTFTNTMQRGGNTDTMYDLIAGIFGGSLTATYSIFKPQNRGMI